MDRIHTIMPVPNKTNSHILTVYYTNMAVHINVQVTIAEQKERKVKHRKHTGQL